MSVVLQIHRFPEDLKRKIEGFASHDRRHGKLMTLVFRDGTKILNAYVIDEEKTKDDFEELKDRFPGLADVTRQGWTMKEPEDEWWKE